MEILNANKDHKEQVVRVLSESFQSDPILNWISPKKDFPKLFFGTLSPIYFPHNHAYMVSDGSGTLLCLPLGVSPSLFIAIKTLFKILIFFDFSTLKRAVKVHSELEKHHYPSPHFYLFAMGVSKEAQGKGIGTRLLQESNKHCDLMGIPAYLENTNEANLPLYERLGFRTFKELKIDDAPTIWLMAREPQKVTSV